MCASPVRGVVVFAVYLTLYSSLLLYYASVEQFIYSFKYHSEKIQTETCFVQPEQGGSIH